MRSIPFYPLMVVLLIGLGGYLGCDPNSIRVPSDLDANTTASANTQYSASIPQRNEQTLLIGSFNMQRLGPSKLADDWVMEKFAAIIRHFDVLALQEITSKDQRTVPILLERVNQGGQQYDFTISPRIGRTTYQEQYAFIYDTQQVRSGSEFSYTVTDEADMLHREPFVGRFQTIVSEGEPFQFTLINIHTDPDEVDTEIDVLANVFRNVRQYEYPEDDVILLGDLNAEPNELGQLGQLPGLISLINDMPTNTRGNKTIDNLLVDRTNTQEFTGRAGTIDLESMFGVDLDDALRISDHLPVWAEFTVNEQVGEVREMASIGAATLR